MRLRYTGDAGRWTAPVAIVASVSACAVVSDQVPAKAGAVLRLLAGVACVAALLAGARRHRCRPVWAWLVLTSGVGVWVAGDFLWDMLDASGADPASVWYTVANCLYVITYPALFAAILGLVGGNLKGSFENAADSVTFALATAVLLRMFVVDASFDGNTLDMVFNAAYPLGDALLLGGVVWIFFTIGARNPALWILGGGMTAMLGVDIVWDVMERYSVGWLEPVANAGYPFAYALIAVTTLHPASARISREYRPQSRYVHRPRLYFLCASVGVITLVALVGNRNDLVLDTCMVFMVAVIAVRLARLVAATESAYREADRNERRFRSLANGVPVGILEADPSMEIVFANEESVRQLGLSAVGYRPVDLQHLVSDNATPDEQASMDRGLSEVVRGHQANAQIRIRGPQGEERWLAWYAMPAGDGANTGAFLATVDITALKDAESMLALQASHDALTGLPNRRLLFDRLSQYLHALERSRGSIAVLFMDLDRFKPVNDELGHDAGDRLLQVIAGRLQTVVRATDTVARVGGDEFVVVLGQLPADPEGARATVTRVAEKIAAAVVQPVELDLGRPSVGTSIGIVVCPDPHEDPDGLLRDADAAMYVAKRSPGQRYAFFGDSSAGPETPDELVSERRLGDVANEVDFDAAL